MVLPYDVETRKNEIQKNIDEEVAHGLEIDCCGVSADGEFDHTEQEDATCPNTSLDWQLFPYCRARAYHTLSLRLDHYRWLSVMAEHFWQNNMGTQGTRFLEQAGFVTSYR